MLVDYSEEAVDRCREHIKNGTRPDIGSAISNTYAQIRNSYKLRSVKYKQIKRYYELSMEGKTKKEICKIMRIVEPTASVYHRSIIKGGLINKYSGRTVIEGLIEWQIPVCTLLNTKVKRKKK